MNITGITGTKKNKAALATNARMKNKHTHYE